VTSDYVTRAEFNGLATRVEWLDEHGTRGVGALQVQVTGLARDMGKLETAIDQHERLHAVEARERMVTRRWLIASVLIPTLTVLIAAAGVLLAVSAR
jgi:hypothetical protein